MRDSYTNRNHCPSHEMWSYERDGRSSGVLLYADTSAILVTVTSAVLGVSFHTHCHIVSSIIVLKIKNNMYTILLKYVSVVTNVVVWFLVFPTLVMIM